MKKADSAARINAVSARKIVIEIKGASESHLSVEAGLLNVDEGPVLHATTVLKAGWPEAVIESLNGLRDAVEEHLLRVHFEEDEYRDREEDRDDRDDSRYLPPSIIGLGGTEDTTPQL